MSELDALLRPRSVAIIGASINAGVISGIPQRILAQHGYPGTVYPVNPRYSEINGLPCYPDIGAVPGPVDVALIVVGAETVPEVLSQCGKAGVTFAVIISSGFAEQASATDRTARLQAVRADYPGIRVLGPNAEGLINLTDGIPLGFSPTIDYTRGLEKLRTGDVAVIAHSGGLGFALFNNGLAAGLGFSHIISTGNEADLDLAELASYLLDQADTQVLLLFVEGLSQPEQLSELAAAARARGKTLVVAKVGDTPAGARAALAHTAHDAGDEQIYTDILGHGGILRALDQEHMVDLAMALSRTRAPAGDRVGVVTTSGGAGTWAADDLVHAGLAVPVLSDGLQARLRERIPAYGGAANPVDPTAQVLGRGGIAPVVELLADSGEVDDVVLVSTLADPQQLEREKFELATIAARFPLMLYTYTRPAPASVDLLEELGIAYYTTSRRTAAALKGLVDAENPTEPPCGRVSPYRKEQRA
jgi:acyl-CoA synthetase (NDP forming)